MILDTQSIFREDGAYIIAGTCFVSGTLNRGGTPASGQVILFDRETCAVAGSKCSDTAGAFRIQIVAASGQPITSTSSKVMVTGRDYVPVTEDADTDDYVALVVVT